VKGVGEVTEWECMSRYLDFIIPKIGMKIGRRTDHVGVIFV